MVREPLLERTHIMPRCDSVGGWGGPSVDDLPAHSRPLDESLCRSADLSSLHRDIALGILELQTRVGSASATTRVALNTQGAHLVFVVPAREACAAICLYLYVDPRPTLGTIGLSAGRATYVNIPEDVYPPLKASTSAIVVKAVGAIIDGHLEETRYCTEQLTYKHVFRLRTSIGEISVTRLRPLMRLRTLFRKTEHATILYPPYAETKLQ